MVVIVVHNMVEANNTLKHVQELEFVVNKKCGGSS